MLRPRLIPVLLLKNGVIVRSQVFSVHQVIGNPFSTIERYSHWNVDELILLDIAEEDIQDLRRDDLQIQYQSSKLLDLLEYVSSVCSVPLSVGGRIRSLSDIQERLAHGADKCIINTQALERPAFITEASTRFGAQCVVVSIDVSCKTDGSYEVYSHGGSQPTGKNPVDWAKEVEQCGAGEIFLNSIDRDGSSTGLDQVLLSQVADAVNIPVIGCGGVGCYADICAGFQNTSCSAIAAANIFHFFELSYPYAKQCCLDAGIALRPVQLDSPYQARTPVYRTHEGQERINTRLRQAEEIAKTPNIPGKKHKIRWCTKCVYPSISAAPMEFNEEGVCTGCQMADGKDNISASEWERRKDLLRGILDEYRSRDGSNYDCIIPVSGGKDSYFQAHVLKEEFGLRPLLVTYNGNNYLPVGWRNVHRMKDALGLDHLFFSPSVEVLKKLNRLGFLLMGDMNWHAHVGITTLPIRFAAQVNTPLLIWGEHGYLDLCGQFSMNDFPEMSYRDRLEHFARGFEWNYMLGLEGLTAQDLLPYQYPSDTELFSKNIRGIYLGNYVRWEANEHIRLIQEKYNFEMNEEPFERTYRRMSNLDDMHENGLHDYLKYIKFGYGRCTDHVCKDIRAGLMTREEGIERVRQMDHIKPKDKERWFSYVGMKEDEFDAIADTFRDLRVWEKKDGVWVKEDIWDALEN